MKKLILLLSICNLQFAICNFSFAQKLDRSKKPQPSPAPEIKLGQIESFTLANGLKIFVVENHKLPRVAFSLVLDIDPVMEYQAKGFVDIAGQLLLGGTKNREKPILERDIDFIGATLTTSPTGVNASSLKKHQEKLLELMSDIVLNSNFNDEELGKLKKKAASNLASQKDNADAISTNVMSALIYGKNHPYGEVINEQTIENVGRDKCEQYYKTYFRPNVAYLAIVGDITTGEMQSLIEKYFGKWERGEVPKQTYTMPAPPAKRRVAVVNKAGAVQSVINVCYPADLKQSSPDVIKSTVLNTILGGGFSSRLFLNLREKNGYTYGSYSKLSKDELAGYFTASAKVRNIVTDSAVTEIINEMSRLRNEKAPDAEVQGVKNYLTGVFSIGLENPQIIANYAISIDRYKLPKDYYTNYLKNLATITADDVSAMAQKYILPDNAFVVIVGNKEEVAQKLKKFSPSQKVEYFDTYGRELKEAIPAGVTAKTVLENYIKAIGGATVLKTIKDATVKMSGTLGGQNLEVMVCQKSPNKVMLSSSVGGNIVQKQVYDGKAGKSTGMQGTKDATGIQLEELKHQSHLFIEMKYEELGYKTELKGIESVNGKDAYQIEIAGANGKKETNYFDKESGLKIRGEKTTETPQGSVMITIDLSDYKEYKGIKFPYTINQTAAGQAIPLKVTSIELNSNLSDGIFKIE